jgi:hypothetical protein
MVLLGFPGLDGTSVLHLFAECDGNWWCDIRSMVGVGLLAEVVLENLDMINRWSLRRTAYSAHIRMDHVDYAGAMTSSKTQTSGR